MTLHRYKEIQCPDCSAKDEVIVLDTINAQVSPEAKTALLEGKTNLFACPRCRTAFFLDRPLLYHDMQIGYMAWYFPFALVQSGKILDWIDPDGQAKGLERNPECDYAASIHYVFDMDELVRYVRFRDVLAEETTRAEG